VLHRCRQRNSVNAGAKGLRATGQHSNSWREEALVLIAFLKREFMLGRPGCDPRCLRYTSTVLLGRSCSELEKFHRTRRVMKKQIYSALIVAAVAGAPFSAFAGAGRSGGPPTSSYRDWLVKTQDTAPAAVPSASPFEGSRPPSLNNWPGMAQELGPAAVSSANARRE